MLEFGNTVAFITLRFERFQDSQLTPRYRSEEQIC